MSDYKIALCFLFFFLSGTALGIGICTLKEEEKKSYVAGHSHEIDGFIYVYPDSNGVITVPGKVDGTPVGWASISFDKMEGCHYVQAENGSGNRGGKGGEGLSCGEGSKATPGKGGDSGE
jgi:hypothetical protein